MSSSESTTNRPSLKAVNLPADTIDIIDAIGSNLSAGIEEATGVPVELSRPQIIQSIAKKVLADQDAAADAAEAAEHDGDEAEAA